MLQSNGLKINEEENAQKEQRILLLGKLAVVVSTQSEILSK